MREELEETTAMLRVAAEAYAEALLEITAAADSEGIEEGHVIEVSMAFMAYHAAVTAHLHPPVLDSLITTLDFIDEGGYWVTEDSRALFRNVRTVANIWRASTEACREFLDNYVQLIQKLDGEEV